MGYCSRETPGRNEEGVFKIRRRKGPGVRVTPEVFVHRCTHRERIITDVITRVCNLSGCLLVTKSFRSFSIPSGISLILRGGVYVGFRWTSAVQSVLIFVIFDDR